MELSSSELLQIGDAAERVGLSLRTVRYWEEVGLVAPAARSRGGFRLYSQSDVARLRVVKAMKPLGLTLEEMREILELLDAAQATNPTDAVVARIETVTEIVEGKIGEMERYLQDARVLHNELERARSRVQPATQIPKPLSN